MIDDGNRFVVNDLRIDQHVVMLIDLADRCPGSAHARQVAQPRRQQLQTVAADGWALALHARLDAVPLQERFDFKMPVNYSSDLGETWQWGVSEFPVVSSVQKPAMLRLKEGPIVLCSFTDQWRNWKNRQGLRFRSNDGDYTGYGLFAAVSYDEGKTWPDRRLLAPSGKTIADGYGYLAITQTRDGRIQLITSQNHYVFNLDWIKALPAAPKK